MKIAKRIGIGFVVFIALVAGVGMLLPRQVHVERSIEIAAPAAAIFDRVNNLKRNEEWSPWHAMEPTADYSYSGPAAGVGSKQAWNGKKVGKGTQEIVQSESPKSITTKLDFMEQGTATATWKFSETGKTTKVTWGFDGDMGAGPIGRYFGLFMDSMLGADYEKGLAKLKEVSEKTPPGNAAETGDSTSMPSDESKPDAPSKSEPAEDEKADGKP